MAGVVAPNGMKTLGVTVTFVGSLLVSVMVTPPDGANVAKFTGNGTDWFVPTVTGLNGSWINPSSPTVTFTVPLVYPAALAVIAVEPCTAPVSEKAPVVPPPGIITTLAGRVTNPPGLAESVTDKPLGGAAALRVRAPFTVC